MEDEETLLDRTNTLVAAFRSKTNGTTPSDFVIALLREFGESTGKTKMCTAVLTMSHVLRLVLWPQMSSGNPLEFSGFWLQLTVTSETYN